MSTSLLEIETPPPKTTFKERKRRLAFICIAVLVAVLIAIHHIRLETTINSVKKAETELREMGRQELEGKKKRQEDELLNTSLPPFVHDLVGPEREPGIPGPRGEPGVPGSKGEPGVTGPKGEPGTPGSKGESGIHGQKEEPGQAGARGEPGFQGLPGLKGDPGAIGAMGPKGDTGPPGMPGQPSDLSPITNRLEILEAKLALMSRNVVWKSCGGYIPLSGSHEIVYEVPPTGVLQGCAWIVAAKNVWPIKLQIVQDQVLELSSSFTLSVMYNPNSTTCFHQEVTAASGEMSFDVQFIFIFFYGKTSSPGQGFKLNIHDIGSTRSSKQITFIRKNNSFGMKYPQPPMTSYDHHQAFFILGAPPAGMRINVTVSQIATEMTHDWVTLLWMDNQRLSSFCDRRTGTNVANIEASVPENMPFVLFFWSDVSLASTGFKIDAIYY